MIVDPTNTASSKEETPYLPKDVGFEDIWEEQMDEDGNSKP